MEVSLSCHLANLERLAKRIVDQCELGSTVGYAIRFEDVTSKATKIKC
jgi:HrpA-like RNA helicase